MKKQTFPIVGFMAIQPSKRIVKVMIEPCHDNVFPFVVRSLERSVAPDNDCCQFVNGRWQFRIVDPSIITLYKSRKKAEKAQLEKLHDQYRNEKRALRLQEKRVKLANQQVAEYKAYQGAMAFYLN